MKKKPWKEMTEKEINKLKTDQCSRCIYLSGSIGRSKTVFANRTCDYIAHHGHSIAEAAVHWNVWRKVSLSQ